MRSGRHVFQPRLTRVTEPRLIEALSELCKKHTCLDCKLQSVCDFRFSVSVMWNICAAHYETRAFGVFSMLKGLSLRSKLQSSVSTRLMRF